MPLTNAQQVELQRLLEIESDARQRRKIDTIFPAEGPFRRELYPKHLAFMAAGGTHRERALMAGNRTGKSLCAGFEIALHATGNYPPWWEGKRFSGPVTIWAAGDSLRDLRDSAQMLLLGPPGQHGTGLIPGDLIARTTARAGSPDGIDTAYVRHAHGGTSSVAFKSYDQGRESFQAASVHVVWLDEEPPMPIYTEALMRTATTGGIVLSTFTPLRGLSEVAMKFLPNGKSAEPGANGPFVQFIEWDDVPHLTTEAKAELLASIPAYQRDSRTKGIPQLGSGAIYPFAESEFVISPFPVPPYWANAFALDVGWNRTACVFGAIDRDSDTLYITDEIYLSEAPPAVVAAAIRARTGDWMLGAVDPAARGRGQADGGQLLTKYTELGLTLIPANNAVEAGLYEVGQRLSTSRLKVFSTCQNLLTEYRIYRRNEKGQVVKERDHLMDALRYLVMTGLSVARVSPGHVEQSIGSRLPPATDAEKERLTRVFGYLPNLPTHGPAIQRQTQDYDPFSEKWANQ